MQDAVKYAIYHDNQPLRIFESRKCQNRKYFNPKAICQKGRDPRTLTGWSRAGQEPAKFI